MSHFKLVEESSEVLCQEASWKELLDEIVDGKFDVTMCTPPGHTFSIGTEGRRYFRGGQSTETYGVSRLTPSQEKVREETLLRLRTVAQAREDHG